MLSRIKAVLGLFPFAAALALWLVLFSRLSTEWSVNPQYQFGWAVPFFGAYLLWDRWQSRPERGKGQPHSIPLLLGVGILALAWLPTRFVLEGFPDWRPVLWAMSFEAVGLTLLILHASGGSRWVRHFLFPVVFLLVAVPWPTPFENFALQGLMRFNADIAAGTLTLFGHPAIQRGNLIEISGGYVGIDEACSGMRSMQAALMIALLMGEFFRFSVARRILMVVAGLGIAFATNVGRSLYLVGKAASDGVASIAGVHDQAGFLTMGICVVGLWIIGWVIRPRGKAGTPRERVSRRDASALPVTLAVSLFAVIAGTEIATETWYRTRGSELKADRPWSIQLPEVSSTVIQKEIPANVREILGIDSGSASGWSHSDGSRWFVHLLRWDPAPIARAILAKYHTPDVCMPASGAILRDDLGPVEFKPNGFPIAFHHYVFEENGLPVQVFYMLLEDRSAARGRVSTSLMNERLRLAWEGQRVTGQTAMHVAIRGIDSPEDALRELGRELANWIVPAAPAANGI